MFLSSTRKDIFLK